MRATDPVVTFLLVLAVGMVVGVLFDRLAGRSWLARQFSGSILQYHRDRLVGGGWRIRRLSHRCADCAPRRAVNIGHCSSDRRRCSDVRLADG